jgi:hypothetical protein
MTRAIARGLEDKGLALGHMVLHVTKGPKKKRASAHFFPMWVFHLIIGFFHDFMLILWFFGHILVDIGPN